MSDDEALAGSLERATEEQRRLRHELAGDGRGTDDGASLDLGIGGSRYSVPAQVPARARRVCARSARATTLGDRILREVAEPWPVERCCSEPFRGDD